MAKSGNDSDKSIPDDVAALDFEKAMAELETVVAKLESGDVDLESSIAMYARGTHLRRHCEAKLKAAQSKVEKLRLDEKGENANGAVPFDAD